QSRAKDRAIGQGNLFDFMGTGISNVSTSSKNGFKSIPKADPVSDYPPQEKLRMEKELLGFYVSAHPLKNIKQSSSLLAPINLVDLGEQKDKNLVCVVVMLNHVKKVMTKKGEQMAILQIEDLTTTSEAVVFPKTYERINGILEIDARLIVWGKVDKRDEQTQLLVEDAEQVEKIQMVVVELNPHEASSIDTQHHLRSILKEQSGDKDKAKVPVIGIVQAGSYRQVVRFGKQYWVQDASLTVHSLRNAQFSAHGKQLSD
ncbi:OB-fold nucleic acid binding domain-containing protein, partial [Cylindrospermopsis raciborskii]